MKIKELLKKYEEFEKTSLLDDMEDETGMNTVYEDFEEDDELGLYMQTDGKFYNRYIVPAIKDLKKGKKVDWLRIAKIGAGRYFKEFNTMLDDEAIKSGAEYIENYFAPEANSSLTESVNRWATEEDKEYGIISEDEYLETFEYIYSQRVNGNLSDYKEKLAELQKEGELRDYANWAKEYGVDAEIEDYIDGANAEDDVEEDDTDNDEEDFESIYSSLVNGNITQYKKQLKRLQRESKLKAYKAWANEMGVDTEVSKYLESIEVKKSVFGKLHNTFNETLNLQEDYKISNLDYAISLTELIFGKVGNEPGNFKIYKDIATANVSEILKTGGIKPIIRAKTLNGLIDKLEAVRAFMEYKGIPLQEALKKVTKINAKAKITEVGPGDFKFQIGDCVRLTRKANAEGKKYFGNDFELRGFSGEVVKQTAAPVNIYTVKAKDGREEDVAETLLEFCGKKSTVKESWSLGELNQVGAITEAPTLKYRLYQNKGGEFVITTHTLDNWALMSQADYIDEIIDIVINNYPEVILGYDRDLLKDKEACSVYPLSDVDPDEEDSKQDLWDVSTYYADDIVKVESFKNNIKTKIQSRRKKPVNEVSKETADKVNAKRQVNSLIADAKAKSIKGDGEVDRNKKKPEVFNPNLCPLSWDNTDISNLSEVRINEILDNCELCDRYSQCNKVAELNDRLKKMEDLEDEANILADKATKSNELNARWKKSKGIKESAKVDVAKNKVVASFDNGSHEIVKCNKGYFNRYNIKDGKARTTTESVSMLPTALSALKKKFPNAEEDK